MHEGRANEEMGGPPGEVDSQGSGLCAALLQAEMRVDGHRLLTSLSHLCTASLSLSHFHIEYSSIVAPALPIPRYSSESVSTSKNLPALMVSPPKPNRLRKEGGKKNNRQARAQQPLAVWLAGILDLSLLLRFHEQQSLSGDLTP